jgi:hypothetical protein
MLWIIAAYIQYSTIIEDLSPQWSGFEWKSLKVVSVAFKFVFVAFLDICRT